MLATHSACSRSARALLVLAPPSPPRCRALQAAYRNRLDKRRQEWEEWEQQVELEEMQRQENGVAAVPARPQPLQPPRVRDSLEAMPPSEAAVTALSGRQQALLQQQQQFATANQRAEEAQRAQEQQLADVRVGVLICCCCMNAMCSCAVAGRIPCFNSLAAID